MSATREYETLDASIEVWIGRSKIGGSILTGLTVANAVTELVAELRAWADDLESFGR